MSHFLDDLAVSVASPYGRRDLIRGLASTLLPRAHTVQRGVRTRASYQPHAQVQQSPQLSLICIAPWACRG